MASSSLATSSPAAWGQCGLQRTATSLRRVVSLDDVNVRARVLEKRCDPGQIGPERVVAHPLPMVDVSGDRDEVGLRGADVLHDALPGVQNVHFPGVPALLHGGELPEPEVDSPFLSFLPWEEGGHFSAFLNPMYM